MFLLKITNKLLSSYKLTLRNDLKYLEKIIEILKLRKKTFSCSATWLLLLIFTNLQTLNVKTSFFISCIYYYYFKNRKLISYIISINLFPTNTLINVNNIKGNPKLFYSAGMLNLQKKQKIRQPKAIITILRALLLKLKIYKIKPVALHFNNLYFRHQSYIFKKLKQKTFTKLVVTYNYSSHNGCRLKKKKRIKIRTRSK